MAAVKEHHADYGVALDGDADRLQLVDAAGRLYNGDELLFVMVADRLAVARACLWNFIVHSDGEQEYRRTKRTLDEVSETIPARILALHETLDEARSAVVGDDQRRASAIPAPSSPAANKSCVSPTRNEWALSERTVSPSIPASSSTWPRSIASNTRRRRIATTPCRVSGFWPI